MPAASDEQRLPRRDLVLIPLIALATALLMLGCAEAVARRYFAETQEGSCGTPDPILPYRYAPNCSFKNKAAEGPLVSYAFNECGFRTPQSCGPKPPDRIRIALLGASTAMGFKAPYEDSMAAQAESALAAACGRSVEFQNMGVAGFKLIDQYHRMGEALALKPDMVVLVLTPYELVSVTSPEAMAHRDHPERLIRSAHASDASKAGLLARAAEMLSNSRAALAAQFLLFQNRDPYIKLFLKHGDKADYLRDPLTPAWLQRLADVDVLVAGMAERAKAQGVPFAIVFTPQRIQAALADPSLRPPGIDPSGLGRALQKIAQAHDIAFVDSVEDFLRRPAAEQLFYPVDGHMTSEGHRVTGRAMARGLAEARQGVFANCRKASTPTP